MKNYIYPVLFITIFLLATNHSKAQIKVNSDGQVKILGDRETDDENKELSMQVFGKYGDCLAGGRIGIGDYGATSRNGSNIFIGELGTWDSDRLQLHGKKGIYLTYGQGYETNEIIGKWDISEPDRFSFEVDVYAKGLLLHSDEKFKTNIKPLGKKLYKLKQLKGVSYELKKDEQQLSADAMKGLTEKEQADMELMKNQKKNQRKRLGFLAQDVQALFPELVEEDAKGYKYVDYVGLIPVLVESVKEQQEQIDELMKLAAKKGLLTTEK